MLAASPRFRNPFIVLSRIVAASFERCAFVLSADWLAMTVLFQLFG